MIRETSRIAYEKVMSSNYVGRKQKQVYAALCEFGPCTSSELARDMGESRLVRNNVAARLGELRDLGTVLELPQRVCSVSGHQAYEWKPSDEGPTKPEKRQTKTQIIAGLRARIRELESLCQRSPKLTEGETQGRLF